MLSLTTFGGSGKDVGRASNGRIAAVSRIPNSMEVWWIEANGSVQAAFWYEGIPWQFLELAPAGSVPQRSETI